MKTALILFLMGSTLMEPTFAQTGTAKTSIGRPSEHFRHEHVEIKKHLAHVEQWAGDLSRLNPAEQKQNMTKIVTFLQDHIKPHADWEEKKLYPAVDRRANKGGEMFTSAHRTFGSLEVKS